MKKIFSLFLSLVGIGFTVGSANATLITIGTANYSLDAAHDYNLIYDDDLGVTWLDYSFQYIEPGGGNAPIEAFNTWQNLMNMVAGLNDPGALTYTLNPGVTVSWAGDWRAPSGLNQDGSGPCSGYNCTGSEMGHLFYTELGNTFGLEGDPVNHGDFQNLIMTGREPVFYYSGTELSENSAVAFIFHTGQQFGLPKYSLDQQGMFGVRSGCVSVPEPGTLLFVGSGLVGLGLVSWRKRSKKA